MSDKFKVSNSRLTLYLRCPYAHHVKYYGGLVKKLKAMPLQRGSGVHDAIDTFHKGKSWKKSVATFRKEFNEKHIPSEIQEIGDVPEIVEIICDNYFEYYGNDDDLTYLETELHFMLPLTKDIDMEGYIDGIVEDSKSIVWPLETKVFARWPDLDFMIFNPQGFRYIWAMNQLGYEPPGILWNIIAGKPPSKPTLTTKGVLSKAKLASTPLTVRKGIIELGLDPKDHEDYINSFEYDSFFLRHQVRIPKNTVKQYMGETIDLAKLIHKEGHKNKIRNFSKDCSWCSYKPICQADLRGLDVDFVIKKLYERRENNGKGKEETKSTRKEKARNRRKDG